MELSWCDGSCSLRYILCILYVAYTLRVLRIEIYYVILYYTSMGSTQSWPQASDASRSTKMATIASLVCASPQSPARWGYSSANDRARIDQLLRKFKRYGFFQQAAPDADSLAREADDRLIKSILLDPNHVLRKHF